jgi:hypothetical protein
VSVREYRELEAGTRYPTSETWLPDLRPVRLAADVRAQYDRHGSAPNWERSLTDEPSLDRVRSLLAELDTLVTTMIRKTPGGVNIEPLALLQSELRQLKEEATTAGAGDVDLLLRIDDRLEEIREELLRIKFGR